MHEAIKVIVELIARVRRLEAENARLLRELHEEQSQGPKWSVNLGWARFG